MFKRLFVFTFAAVLPIATTCRAENVCGWYAIAFCSKSKAAAQDFAGQGWGAAISTVDYIGLKSGLHCVVSGPQSKASALRDRQSAISQGVADDVYVKRACTDINNVGD